MAWSPSSLPDNVLPSASDDLARILKRNRPELQRILNDLVRLGLGTLPPHGRKKLKSVNAFQFDSGRYRIVYSHHGRRYTIWAVLAKPEQRDYLRHLRR